MTFHIITIFPDSFKSYIETSILGEAQRNGKIKINFYNPRDFLVKENEKSGISVSSRSQSAVDDKPYGGGAGMLLKAEPILFTVKEILKTIGTEIKQTKIIILSAKGKQFDQKKAIKFSKSYKHLILITGRYEGIDERVRLILKAEEVSVGPYVLTDGELGACILVSSIGRLIPGVIKTESLKEESFLNKTDKSKNKGHLEYPHFTRPETVVFGAKNFKVPKVLLSGNHKKIQEWRKKHQKPIK